MGLRAPVLLLLLLVAAVMPDRCSAKFVSGLMLDEGVAEACSSDLVKPSPPGAAGSAGTTKCVDARLQRARYLRANGHLEASLKDFKACADLLPDEFGAALELNALSAAIALQREGRQLFFAAEEREERKDKSGARLLYQQSIGTLKTAARYLVDLRTDKNNANAKSLTDMAEAAERRSAAFNTEF
jgi:hypothetical protein